MEPVNNLCERLLGEPGVQINYRNGEARTLLSHATRLGHYRVTQLLLEHNADYELSDQYGRTPFWHAAETGNVELVELLLKHGANPKTRDRSGVSALTNAMVEIRHRRWKGIPEDSLLDQKRVIEKLEKLDSVTERQVERLYRQRLGFR